MIRPHRILTAIVMLKIERVLENGGTRFHLSGELRSADVGEVLTEIEKILPRVVLDLAEINVVDIDGVRWLTACRAVGIRVENCASYIREWMLQEGS
jgi:ABC-type transporter Mla MlaB component